MNFIIFLSLSMSIVQINNFQKVSFDYHPIRYFVQKFYRAVLSCRLFIHTPQLNGKQMRFSQDYETDSH